MRVQKPVGNFIRAVLLMPLYVPLFAPKAYSSATASHVYTIVLKVQARCLSTSCKHALLMCCSHTTAERMPVLPVVGLHFMPCERRLAYTLSYRLWLAGHCLSDFVHLCECFVDAAGQDDGQPLPQGHLLPQDAGGHSQGALLPPCPSRLWDVIRAYWVQAAAAEELRVVGTMYVQWTADKQLCNPSGY